MFGILVNDPRITFAAGDLQRFLFYPLTLYC